MIAPTRPDLENIKRGRVRAGTRGQETINQIEHIDSAGAKATISGIISPGDVITTDASAAGVVVGTGALCRIEVTADTYVAFGDVDIGAVTSSTTPAVKLKAGMSIVSATDNYLRSSIALTRLEVIID